MAKIKIKQNRIPFIFENDENEVLETLYFDKSDEHINRFYDKYKELQVMQLKDINKQGDDLTLEELKTQVKGFYDDLFGEGAFDKIYKINSSTIILATYLLEMCTQIAEEINQDQQSEVLEEYISKKK